MKRKDLINLNEILEKLVLVENLDLRWKIAEYIVSIKDKVESIKLLDNKTKGFADYEKEYQGVFMLYGEKIDGTDFYRIKEEYKNISEDKLNEIRLKYKDIIEREIKRLDSLSEAMDKEIEVDIEGFNYEEVKEYIDGLDLVFLMSNNLVIRGGPELAILG